MEAETGYETSYEIFRKEADNTTVAVESVKGIEQAQKRVNELNDAGLGEHFIFDPIKATVVEPNLAEPTAASAASDPFAE